jgi:hypothetical protein
MSLGWRLFLDVLFSQIVICTIRRIIRILLLNLIDHARLTRFGTGD